MRAAVAAPRVTVSEHSHTRNTVHPLARNLAVARGIARELRGPKSNTGFWSATVSWASVPEATVDKNSDFLRSENEIRLSRQWHAAPPAGDASGP
jgi:hypothetical protein